MKAVRLKYCLNFLLLCANTSEKMAFHWASHCLILFCLFEAGYPQIQPPFVCLLLLLPPKYILHVEVQDHQQHWVLMETLLSDPLGSWGVHRGWTWTSVLMGPSPKGKTLKWWDLNWVLDRLRVDQQMDTEQTQTQWLGPDTWMSHFICCWIRGTVRISNNSAVSD